MTMMILTPTMISCRLLFWDNVVRSMTILQASMMNSQYTKVTMVTMRSGYSHGNSEDMVVGGRYTVLQ